MTRSGPAMIVNKSVSQHDSECLNDHNMEPRPRTYLRKYVKLLTCFILSEHLPLRNRFCYMIVICLLVNFNFVDSNIQNTIFQGTRAKNVIKTLNRDKRTTNSRCDYIGVQNFLSECQPCDTSMIQPCGNGFTVAAENGTMPCTFQVEGYGALEGCQFICQTQVIMVSCCHGYYLAGHICLECPGGYSSPCNNRGSCDAKTGVCRCYDNFSGVACELCAPNYYGNSCEGVCTCVHGVCDFGIEGNGLCYCLPGYQGGTCSQANDDCVAAGCHANARCIQVGTVINCSCNLGYNGNGYTCQEIDPCLSHNCSINGICHHTGPLQYNCTCKDNYHGDGILCYPDNPCASNNGGCSLETSVCHYLSPGKSKCECIEPYHMTNEKTCESIDLCILNLTTCQPNAECYMQTPIQTGCRCKAGYVGNHTCYGNIMQRLRELNINTEGSLYQQVTTAIELIEKAGFGVMLSSLSSYFTLLVPNENAFDKLDQQILAKARNDQEFARRLMKLFILPIQLDTHNLRNINCVYNLVTLQAEVSVNQYNCLQYKLASEPNIANLILTDLVTSNGVIHVLDTALYSRPLITSNTSITLYEKIFTEGSYQQFQKCLDLFEYFEFLQHSDGPYTVFVPVNEAFDSLTAEEYQYLTSNQGRVKLRKILENHIISNAQVSVDTFLTQRHLNTLYGSRLDLFVSNRGALEVSSQSTIMLNDILTRNGILHEVSHLIVPDDLRPLVSTWCNVTSFRTIQGNCGSCIEKERLTCPVGTVQVNNDTYRGCIFLYLYGNVYVQQEGCSIMCNETITTPACCGGFYGSSCLPCPGGISQPCLNNGQCVDGIAGNGSCLCKPLFTGSACELCANENKFGSDCEQDCSCLYGVCDNGIDGSGHCKGQCYAGYTGTDCQYQVQTCGGDYCHAHAQCVQDADGIRCVCLFGYERVGLDCVAIDYCSKLTHGLCSPQAYCVYDGPGMYHCECEVNYAGDGMDCSPIDPCSMTSRGGCHQHAHCIYTAPGQNICECDEGYIGSGFDCSQSIPCAGACHPQATCQVEGVPLCICRSGYRGDGNVCYSNIAIEIAGNPLLNNFNQLLTKSNLQQELAGIVNYTVFAAEDSACQDIDIDNIHQSAADDIIRNHIVQGWYYYLEVTDLAMQNHHLQSLNNENLNLTYHNMTIHVNKARIIVNNQPAVNGIIHVIDQVFLSSTLLEPTPSVSTGPGDILQVLSNYPNYSRVRQMLINTGVAQILQELDAYTIFIPNNDALMEKGLSEYDLKYSIVSDHKLYFQNLVDGLRLETLLGTNYDIIFSVINSSMVLVNRIAISEVDIVTNTGVVHGVEAVIPIYRSRCDTQSTIITKTPCVACSEQQACPQGSQNGTVNTCTFIDSHRFLSGCQMECIEHQQNAGCCSGFFGDSCDECPGGSAMPCSNHGNCSQGIMGTGECICNPGFQGFACELCQENFFGTNCDQACNCRNGRCNSGPDGDGQCICYAGWTGQNCDNVDINGACTNCHVSAYCDVSRCICSAGFTGNGSHCEAINMCDSNHGNCSQHASCTPLPHGQRHCNCTSGYYGDGIICQEINPCLHDHGGCHDDAECIHTGPNKNICNCKTNFTGDGVISCKWLNPCSTNNGGCSIRADCQTTGPNMRTCTCFNDHIGDGFTCTGNIAEELALNPDLSTFNRIIKTNEFQNLWLSVEGPYTMLAPQNSAFDALPSDQIEIWQKYNQIADIVDYLTIGCAALDVDQLKQRTQITTANGQKLRMEVKDSLLLLNGVGKVKSSIKATNGIIHIIDTVLIPGFTRIQNASLLDCLLWNNYTTLVNMMNKANMFQILDDPFYKPFTIFAPTNQAFESLPADKKYQLDNDVDILKEYLKFHVLPEKRIRLSEIVLSTDSLILLSLQGSIVFAGCGNDNGDGYVNSNAKLLQSNIMFADGVVFGIDMLLDPPSIGGRCDEVTYTTIKSPCQDCAVQFTCSDGFKIVGDAYRDCYYTSGWYQTDLGCRVDCVKRYVSPRCCTNYYGLDCLECPGGQTPCSNNGECYDGIDNNGTCRCYANFYGDSCQWCQPGYYGPQCTKCSCSDHGICEEGITGSGTCFCLTGWTGEHCDQSLAVIPTCSPSCHEYAVCHPNSICECLPQYEGDGRACSVKHVCAYLNGGCSQLARCEESGGSVHCTCDANYEGNGWTCTPKNPCKIGNGGCHNQAQCTQTGPNQRSCSCILPYIGDGFNCDITTSGPLGRGKCSSNNGGCSENADCLEIPPSDTNPYGTINCTCHSGYAGNGTLCNGHVYDTLATIPQFSQFYRDVVDYGQLDLQNLLKDSKSKLTIFVPINSDSTSSVDVGDHVVSGVILTSRNLTTTNNLNAYSGISLTVQFNANEKTVNDVIVEEVDIEATNGVLHVIKFSLTKTSKTTHPPPDEESSTDNSMSKSRVFAGILISFTIICVIGISSLLIVRYTHLRKLDSGFSISRFKKKNNDDGGIVYFSSTNSAEDNAFVNPSFSEIGEDKVNIDKKQ